MPFPFTDPGTMRDFVTVESLSTASDGLGGSSGAWVTFAQVYACVEPLAGREVYAAMALQSKVTHKVTIRYLEGAAANQRIPYDGFLLYVQAVLNDGMKHFTTLLCDARKNA